MRRHLSFSSSLFLFIALALLVAVVEAEPQADRLSVGKLGFPVAFAPDRSNSLLYSGDGRVAFAASFRTDTLFSFDSSTGALLGSLPTGDGPASIALNESGGRRLLAVANAAFIGSPVPSITFVDATDPSKLELISTAGLKKGFFINSGVQTLAFNVSGTAGFVTVIGPSGGAALFSLDVATGALLGKLNLDFLPVSAARAGRTGEERLVLIGNSSQRSQILIVDINNARSIKISGRIVLPAGAGFANENNIGVSEDGSFAYLGSADSGQVYAIDLLRGRLAAQVSAGNFPAQVDLVENGQERRLAVTAIFDGAVNIFDASDPAALKKVATFKGQSPVLTTAPVLSADGRLGFVATEVGNRLYGFDATTGAQISLQELNGPPSSLRITHGTVGRLGLMDTLNNRVLLFELNGGALNPTGNFETRDGVNFTITQNILLSQDGRRAFVASPSSNEILVIDTEKRAVTERIKVGEQPERIALVEAGGKSRVAVVNIRSASVSLVEIGNDGSRVTGTVKLPGRDQSLLSLLSVELSSDGLFGFVSDGVSKLLKFNAVSGEIVDSLSVGRDPVGLKLYERNGERRVAIVTIPADDTASVVVVDATDKLRETARYNATTEQKFALNNLPVFSQDGQTIFIVSSFSLELLSIDSTTGRLISRLKKVNAIQPTLFTSQGRDLLIAVNIGASSFPIIEVSPDGRLQVRARLKRPKEHLFIVGNNAVVVPDGTRAYVTNYSSGEIIIFEPATGAVLQTVPLGNGAGNLAFSNNGGRFVVLETNGGANFIDIIDVQE